MARDLALCIVGAGSSYTPELIEGILARTHEQLPITQLRLMDIEPKRLEVMAGLAQRMVTRHRRPLSLSHGVSLAAMLDGADVVVTQIRVGGMDARHIDEMVPMRHGIIGQETTGPGGMFKALRTIPPMLEIARAVERIAPQAFILNYTNPSGIITEAVRRHTRAKLIGLCSGMPGIQDDLQRRLGPIFPGFRSYVVGLNHLGFVHRMTAEGRDITHEAIARWAEQEAEKGGEAAERARLATLLGAIPISYADYFYHRGHKLQQGRSAPETRAQQVRRLERDVLSEAADITATEKPASLAKRGGGGYSNVTFTVLEAILNDSGREVACSVPNRGAVHGIDDEAVVEVSCRIDGRGATPQPVGAIPLSIRGTIQAMKAYETLTVAAAITRDRRLVMQALANHPLVGDVDVIEPLIDELLEAHQLVFS